MYGVNKVAGELLADYYYYKFGVDTRGIRFPGLISNVALPGGEQPIMLWKFIMKLLRMENILLILLRVPTWI